MMTRRTDSFVLTLLMAVALMVGCGKGSILPHFGEDGRGLPQALLLADSLMNSRPDSALAVLEGAEGQMAGEPKSVRMRYQLLRHQAMNKADVPFTSDSLMLDVADYYDRHGTANDRVQAHYLLGCVYRDLKEAPHAIDCFKEAITKADTTSSDCDFITYSRIYAQMAGLYHQQLLLTNEIQAHQKATRMSLYAKDTLHAIYHLGMSAGPYMMMNKNDSAEIILKSTLGLYQQYGYLQEGLQASTMLMHLYANTSDRSDDLKKLIDRYDSECAQFDSNHNLPPSLRLFYYYKGRYFELIDQLDSAEFYYRKMQKKGMSWAYQNSMYKGLLCTFKKKRQSDSIAKYVDLYCQANDSSVVRKDQQQTALLAASYDYVFYKNQFVEKAKVAQTQLHILILLIVIIAGLVIFFLERRHKNAKQQQKKQSEIRLLRAECVSLSESLDNKEMELQAQDESYQRIISAIKEDMDTKYDESQSIISKLNLQHEEEKKRLSDEINQKKKEMLELEKKIQIYAGKEILTPYLRLGIVNRVRLFADKSDKKLSEEDQNKLIEATGECYPNFITDLKHTPKIGELGIRVGILIALNIKPRDITHLLDMPYNQISNIKQDLNQGLFNENTARTLYQNLCMRYKIMPY